MTGGYSDIQRARISFDGFAIPTIEAPRYNQTHLRFSSRNEGSLEALGKILQRFSRTDLPGKAGPSPSPSLL